MSEEVVPLGIVIPVRNEAVALPGLLASLAEQQAFRSVRCLALVDGRSEDNSRAIIASWHSRLPALRLIDNPRRITPVAFNLGIQECLRAGAEVVLLSGAHSCLALDYIQELQTALKVKEADIIGAVHDYPKPRTLFDRAVQAYSESRFGRRLGFLSKLKEPTETGIAFHPAIGRQVFERIGYFDESLVRNQDNDFESRARAAGFKIVTNPHLRYTYIPRGSLGRLLHQMYGNGVGVGRRPRAHSFRHLAPALLWANFILSAIVGALLGWPWYWWGVAGGALYLFFLGGETVMWLPRIGLSLLWLPLLFIIGHAAYAVGTFQSLFMSLWQKVWRR
jgi:succinoglycan biosynthesis protein ExoA